MSELKVSDIVKSFDFVGNDSHYMIGEVVSVNKSDGMFRARLIKRVCDGEVSTNVDWLKDNEFVAPLQGNHFMDDAAFPRVVVLA